MKVCRIPIFTLLLILALALGNSATLTRCCSYWTQQLDIAGTAADSGDWETAQQALEAVHRDWEDHQTWLHIVIDHGEIDETDMLLRTCQLWEQAQDDTHLRVSLAELRAKLELLDEMEHISIKNVL